MYANICVLYGTVWKLANQCLSNMYIAFRTDLAVAHSLHQQKNYRYNSQQLNVQLLTKLVKKESMYVVAVFKWLDFKKRAKIQNRSFDVNICILYVNWQANVCVL
jgi:hypothetical protein